MTKPHGAGPEGTPVDLIGQPIGRRAAPGVGISIYPAGGTPMAKAEHNGVYKLGESQFVIRKGDVLPDGAEMLAEVVEGDAEIVSVEYEERAKKAAPQNRSKGSAPENRSEG
jgi:hypothetical protein